MPALIKQTTDLWSRMKFGQRIAVLTAAGGTIALIVALVVYGSQPEYAVLFSDLKPADAQTIVEKLKSKNVQYKLTNNGTAVSVPSEQLRESWQRLSRNGRSRFRSCSHHTAA